jgi:Helix-turn-helix domain
MVEPVQSSGPASGGAAVQIDFGYTRRERLAGLGVVVLALLLVAVLIAAFWEPAPPRTVFMSTGVEDGAYHAYGKRYQEVLSRSGVELVLLSSDGSPQHLDRLTRAATGDSALRLIEARTIREARRHLAYTNLSIATIAYALGYADPAYFTRAFTRDAGVSPRIVRAQLSGAVLCAGSREALH